MPDEKELGYIYRLYLIMDHSITDVFSGIVIFPEPILQIWFSTAISQKLVSTATIIPSTLK